MSVKQFFAFSPFFVDRQAQDLMIIDCNSVGYTAMHKPELADMKYKGQSISALHGLPSFVFALMDRYPNAMPLLVWDGNCQWRKRFNSEYKSNRADTPEKIAAREDYDRQRKILKPMFKSAGFPVVEHSDIEADDVAGRLCRNMPPDTNIVLVTADMDWVQGMSKNVTVFDTRNWREINLDYLKKRELNSKDGIVFSPEIYLAAKCMAGDTSDHVSGAEGIGIKTAIKYLQEHGSFEQMWSTYDSRGPDEKPVKGVKLLSAISQETRSLYYRNRKIMDWSEGLMPAEIPYEMHVQDIVASQRFAFEYGLDYDLQQEFLKELPQDKWCKNILYKIELALVASGGECDRVLEFTAQAQSNDMPNASDDLGEIPVCFRNDDDEDSFVEPSVDELDLEPFHQFRLRF